MFSKIIRTGLILCLCMAALAVTANAQESISPHKRELIQELFALTVSQANVEGVIDEILRQREEEIPKLIEQDLQENKELTPQEREEMRRNLTEKSVRFSKRFRELLPQRINLKQELEAIILLLYDKYLTEDEIAQTISFYKSPAGKKMTEVMPRLIPEMMRRVQETVAPKIDALVKELIDEEKKSEIIENDEPVADPR